VGVGQRPKKRRVFLLEFQEIANLQKHLRAVAFE
jgi:hypothetical protein